LNYAVSFYGDSVILKWIKSSVAFLLAVYLLAIGVKALYPALTFERPKPVTLQEMNNFSNTLTTKEAIDIYVVRETAIFRAEEHFSEICAKENAKKQSEVKFLINTNDCINNELEKYWSSIQSGYALKSALFLLLGVTCLVYSIHSISNILNKFRNNLESKFSSDNDRLIVAKIFDTEHSEYLKQFREELVEANRKSRNNGVWLALVTTLSGVLLSYLLSFLN
jgi:hypothetical protein